MTTSETAKQMNRKRVLMTGGTDGIGFVVAGKLAKEGAELVLLCRNAEKGQRVKQQLIMESGNSDIHLVQCDLSSLDDIRRAAAEVLTRFTSLDLLINCAGVYLSGRHLSADGHEMHFAVNYLAGYLLTRLLIPALEQDHPTRIVVVSGETARLGKIRFDDLDRQQGFSTLGAYAQSKLANIMFAFSMAERLKDTAISCVAMHPGPAATSHLQSGPGWLSWFWSNLTPGPESAAEKVLQVALKPADNEKTLTYFFGKWRFRAPSRAYNRNDRERLWTCSEELVAWGQR